MKSPSLFSKKELKIIQTGHFDTRFGISKEFSIGICPTTGILQTTPIPSDEALNTLYEKHYNFPNNKNILYDKARSIITNSFFYRFWLFFFL